MSYAIRPTDADQARLRPHLRDNPPPIPRSRRYPEKAPPDRRITDLRKLRGIGMVGNPKRFARGIAGAGQLDLIRKRERDRIVSSGDTIDITHVLSASASCYLCGQHLSVNTAHLEHIIPISRGGTHTTANVAAACRSCNSRKSNNYVAFMVASRKPIYVRGL